MPIKMRNPITISVKGDTKSLTSFFERTKNLFNIGILDKYGEKGVEALRKATPSKSSETANAWSYKIRRARNSVVLEFHNSNIQNGLNVAMILYTGHGTKEGYWVQGVDYINPALKPVFDELAKNAIKEATNNG
jgi:hypothetical protein